MAKKKGLPLETFLRRFSSEAQCQERLAFQRWQAGYVCAKCGCRHGYRLSNRRYQCVQCRHQTLVTAGTILHKTHMPLGTYHGLSKNLQSYLDEYSFRFCRRDFGPALLERLTLAISLSRLAD